jgi:hypothetical protein
MAAIADLERFLERVFERTSARLFRSRVQAVQVQRRVERAMEAGRTGHGTDITVPNRFRVRVHPADLDDLAARNGGSEALAAALADQALAFARLHGYHLVARPTVSVVADPAAERGIVEVDASVWRPAAPPSRPFFAVAPGDAGRSVTPEAPTPEGSPSRELRLADVVPDVVAAPIPSGAEPHTGGIRASGDRQHAVRPVVVPRARALLRVSEPGGREREVPVEGAVLTLGRAPDNGLVLSDARVSRHHGRFANRNGTLLYTDLGSTNGTRVNGIRVDEIVLGAGDRLQVGDVVVVVEQLPR